MKTLFFDLFVGLLTTLLQDLVDDGKINGSQRNEILNKIKE